MGLPGPERFACHRRTREAERLLQLAGGEAPRFRVSHVGDSLNCIVLHDVDSETSLSSLIYRIFLTRLN